MLSNRLRLVSAAVLAGLIAVPDSARAEDPNFEFERYTLDNGIEVILHRDTRLPQIAVNVSYHVGVGDQEPKKSGYAHLFEFLLTSGTEHIEDHIATLRQIGATGFDAALFPSRTSFFEVVPSHQLETALWLESDRMGYLASQIDQERINRTVQVMPTAEKCIAQRMWCRTHFAIAAALYTEDHPHRYDNIGRGEDLARATVEDVRRFHRKWFMPANATLALAGDFEIDNAKRLIDKWFGTFPKTARPKHVAPATPKLKSRRITVEDNLAGRKRVDYVWVTPARFSEGDAELQILAHTLGDSVTGRLQRTLVREQQLADDVQVVQRPMRYFSTFIMSVIAKGDADVAAIERTMNAELERISRDGITEAEAKRAVANIESTRIWELESLMARADMLQLYNHVLGDPAFFSRDLDRYRDATIDQVRKAATEHLTADERLEVLTIPAQKRGKQR